MHEERTDVRERIYIFKKEFCNLVKGLNGVTFRCAGKTTLSGDTQKKEWMAGMLRC